eukprot:4689372-Alexandrium_andersonii.AAC.1
MVLHVLPLMNECSSGKSVYPDQLNVFVVNGGQATWPGLHQSQLACPRPLTRVQSPKGPLRTPATPSVEDPTASALSSRSGSCTTVKAEHLSVSPSIAHASARSTAKKRHC